MSNIFVQQMGDESRRLVWVDSWAYCTRLFLEGKRLDWGNRAKVDEFVRKSDALIDSDVVTLPLHDFLQHALAQSPGLASAMGQKSRSGYALKTLLRDENLRQQFHEAVQVVVGAVPTKPVMIGVPAPRNLLAWAFEAAHQRRLEEITVDHADSASVYLSDFISSLSGLGVSGVFVEEGCADEEAWRHEAEIYVPLRNVTAHQHWQLGLRLGFLPTDKEGQKAFDFVVTPAANASTGLWLDDCFWSGQLEPAEGRLRYGLIPAQANPETVLAQRRLLG